MTSWIWMKGVDTAIADPPIDPVTEHDHRPAVQDLIQEHAETIALIRKGLEDDNNDDASALYDPSKHDDLWILRFVLSHSKKNKKKEVVAAEAGAAAKETLEFRAKYKLDETDIRYDTWDRNSHNPHVRAYMKHLTEDAMVLALPDAQRGVILYFNIGGFDFANMVKELTEDEWLGAFIFGNEWSFQWQDYITRTTGRLTKSIRLIDMKTFTLSCVNRDANKRDAQCMSICENVNPQLLQAIYICNAPGLLQSIWRVVRHIFPKRVLEKFDFLDVKSSEKERKKVLGYIELENLPVKFGGSNEEWPPATFNTTSTAIPPPATDDGEKKDG